jgi:hypothetical protein
MLEEGEKVWDISMNALKAMWQYAKPFGRI